MSAMQAYAAAMDAIVPGWSHLIPPPVEINDTHKNFEVVAAIIVMASMANSITIFRLINRVKTSAFGWDDWVLIPGLLLYDGWTAMAIYMNLKSGVGKPLWEITPGEYGEWFKGFIGSAFLYPAMSCAIRTSILLFLHRCFARNSRWLRISIQILIISQALYLIIFSIVPGFIIKIGAPISKLFDVYQRPFYMDNFYYYNTTVALYSVSVAMDIFMILVPIYPVSQLQMPLQKRVGVFIMFTLYAGAAIAATYKLAVFVHEMARLTQLSPEWATYQMAYLVPAQFDKFGVTFWIPSQVEPTVGLIAHSLPALRTTLSAIYESTVETLSSAWGSRVSTGLGSTGSVSYLGPHSTAHGHVKLGSRTALTNQDFEMGVLSAHNSANQHEHWRDG